MIRKILVVTAAALALAACGNEPTPAPHIEATHVEAPHVTATRVPPPTPTSVVRGESRWSGNGVFSVGDTPCCGARASIPAGRYTVTLKDGETYGYWIRCNDLTCKLTDTEKVIDYGLATGAEFTGVVAVLPTDAGVFLMNTTLTAAAS